jgi:hypothetical protein
MHRLAGLALVGAIALMFVGSLASRAATLARDVSNHALVFESLTLTPSAPFSGDTLRADALASEADVASSEGVSITYAYEWSRNGVVLVGETGPTLDLSTGGNGDSGDMISVRVTASDGELSTEASTSVIVADSAPTVTVRITSSEPASVPVDQGNGSEGESAATDGMASDATAESAVATAEAPVITSAPSVAVSLDTTTPTIKTVVVASVLSQDIDNDGLTYVYIWRLNGVVKRTITTGATTDRYDLSVRGDGDEGGLVTLTVTASDGSLTSPSASVSATIRSR